MTTSRMIGKWDGHEWICDVRTIDEYLTSLATLTKALNEWRDELARHKRGECKRPWRKEGGHSPHLLDPRWESIIPDIAMEIGRLRDRISVLEAAIESDKT